LDFRLPKDGLIPAKEWQGDQDVAEFMQYGTFCVNAECKNFPKSYCDDAGVCRSNDISAIRPNVQHYFEERIQ